MLKFYCFRSIIWLFTGAIILSGCSTTIRSYPVANQENRQGGIPFYVPKPIVQVREPIEISRSETLFAIIDIAGLEKFMYELKPEALNEAIENLKKILNTQQIQVEEKVTIPFYLTEELSKETITKGEHESTATEYSKKYAIAPGSEIKTEQKPFYKPADIEKAFSVVWVPDTTKEYELIITPSAFASSDLTIKLTDGWRLDSIAAKTGDNQLIKELTDTLRTVIGAQKEIKLVEIAKEQALKLKEMEQQVTKPDAETMFLDLQGKKIQAKVIGYVKKTTIKALLPGLHELHFSNGSVVLPQQTTEMWERIQL